MSKEPREVKVVIVGAPSTGRRTLIRKYIHSTVTESYEPSADQVNHKQITIDGEPCLVELSFADAKNHSKLEVGDAFILMYAIDDRGSFIGTRDLYQLLRQTKAKSTQNRLSNSSSPPSLAPVYLVGSKLDLEHERQVSLSEAKSLAVNLQCKKLFEISSKNHTDEIDDLFTKLIKELPSPPSPQQHDQQQSPSPSPRPGLASVQTPTRPTTAISQAQRSTTTPDITPRRPGMFDRLKFGSMRRTPSMQNIIRRKSGSFDETVGMLGSGRKSKDNLRTVSGGYGNVPVLAENGDARTGLGRMVDVREARKESKEEVSMPFRLDVDTSAWRETIKWPTEFALMEEDSKTD